ncbi:MAG: hypothetical protein QOG53_1397 [Frankiales bacterium]|jgi:hypothetical protein|nr:hypothetical protein [Frankiales bacterium]
MQDKTESDLAKALRAIRPEQVVDAYARLVRRGVLENYPHSALANERLNAIAYDEYEAFGCIVMRVASNEAEGVTHLKHNGANMSSLTAGVELAVLVLAEVADSEIPSAGWEAAKP